MTIHQWRTLPTEIRAKFLASPSISRIHATGRSVSLEITETRPDSEWPPDGLTETLLANELHLDELLALPIRGLHGLTGHQLLAAWMSLSTLGVAMTEYASAATERLTDTNLEVLAPAFRRVELIGLLASALRANEAAAQSVLEHFTCERFPRDDLWQKPFVRIGDELTAVATALTMPNILRNIEKTWNDFDIPVDAKGASFEKFLRESLAEDTQIRDSDFNTKRLTLTFGSESEEIDVLFRIARTLVVGEAKCTVSIASPLERYRLQAALAEGASQAARKSDFVRRNLGAVLKAVGWEQESVDRVIPVVISNQAAAAGYSAENVPVVDYPILRTYVEQGYLEVDVVALPDGQIVPSKLIRFYSSELEAGERLEIFLSDPAQLLVFLKRTRLGLHELKDLQSERPVFEVRPAIAT
jgi:hypothetical protein